MNYSSKCTCAPADQSPCVVIVPPQTLNKIQQHTNVVVDIFGGIEGTICSSCGKITPSIVPTSVTPVAPEPPKLKDLVATYCNDMLLAVSDRDLTQAYVALNYLGGIYPNLVEPITTMLLGLPDWWKSQDHLPIKKSIPPELAAMLEGIKRHS